MDESMRAVSYGAQPEFGEVAHRPEPCTPRELFCALFVDLEEHVHYLEPGFRFALGALARVRLAGQTETGTPRAQLEALVTRARAELCVAELPAFGSSWPVRVAREFAPAGLSDGAWLRGWVQSSTVETDVGMPLLKQLMLRFGDPGTSEPYADRYATLLRSAGIVPEVITRWEWDEALPSSQLSYEHALLGLCLGLFPNTLGSETLGFNLWMTELGPCPLLARLTGHLRERGASLRYFDRYDTQQQRELSWLAIERAFSEASDPAVLGERIARGFLAAQRSYARWQLAMLGRNVPLSARDFVLEGIRRKARFAAAHHSDIRLGACSVQSLIQGGPEQHEELLDRIAASRLIRAGDPDRSPFMKHSLSIDGPMFDAFTPAEKHDLREWIAGLPQAERARRRAEPVALEGEYGPPQDLEQLGAYALARYAPLSMSDLYYRIVNADLFPPVALFCRAFITGVLAKVSHALDTDERLNSREPPPYSERCIAEIVAKQHEKNVSSRGRNADRAGASAQLEAAREYVGAIFDGCWLQGFVDVRRAVLEEYGWLFRIYASEHGDGNMQWNHCRIFRHEFAVLGPDIMLPKNDPRLYQLFDVGIGSVAKLAIALNTQHFMPEILGLNLGIEASGVGGEYFERWKSARQRGLKWEALATRLHNSIDNYADGHTKWSLAAVQSFMRRTREAAPAEVASNWHRLWRLWRLQDILTHGSESEQNALAEHLNVRSLAPT